ncbi:hypothetical protein NRP93_002471 [Clostridium botulinum]|nr:hypothetical protein [Clostridium botulinum]
MIDFYKIYLKDVLLFNTSFFVFLYDFSKQAIRKAKDHLMSFSLVTIF